MVILLFFSFGTAWGVLLKFGTKTPAPTLKTALNGRKQVSPKHWQNILFHAICLRQNQNNIKVVSLSELEISNYMCMYTCSLTLGK
jgi:hypothetical protein